MSTTVDNRVVEMQFDNRQFESNVQTSLGTLDKLKQSLNLTGASKGLENINSAAKGVNLSGLSSAAEAVTVRFSHMQMAIQHQFNQLVDSAVHTGKRIVSALTIDPVKTGLQEYETQINAIQTILANTEHKGTTIDQVNTALDELNTYADKTIYNFTEMTRNIGTFTAAGVDLDKSVTSIKGIANLAAVSGSTSQQASTAMYQLSQALAAGRVSLMDWNSVVNAGMGGQVFQNALKRTAKQMGHNVDEIIAKYGSFRESLTQGEWLTTDVLTETLTQLSGAYSKADLIAQGYTESQADEIVKLADTAVNAATKVKTFTQLVDTLKESLQSGWTQTWETIIGDFDQAKELWTGVSDALGEIINKSSESRNSLLEGALTSNWDKMIKRINEAGISSTDLEERVRNIAKNQDKDLDKLIAKYGSLEDVFRSGALSSDILKEAVGKTSKTIQQADFSLVDRVLKGGSRGEDVKQVEAALEKLGYVLTGKDGKDYGKDGYFGTLTEEAVRAFQKAQGMNVTGIVDEKTLEALKQATTETESFSANVDDLIGGIDELGGRELLIESFKNVFSSLTTIGARIRKAFTDVFPPMTSEQLYNLIEGFKKFTDKLKPTHKQLGMIHQTFKGLFSAVDIVLTVVKDLAVGFGKVLGSVLPGLVNGILNVTGSFGTWVTSLRDSLKETDIFGKAVDTVVGFLTGAIGKFKEFASALSAKFDTSGLAGVWSFVQKIGKKVIEMSTVVGKALTSVFSSDNLAGGLDIVNGGIFTAILLGFKNFINGFGDSFDNINGILDNVKGILDGVKGSLEAWQSSLKADTLMKLAKAIGILAVAVIALALVDPEKLNSALGAITMLFVDLIGALSLFGKIGTGVRGAVSAIGLMNGMATAILILALALRAVASLNIKQLATGLIGIAVLTGVVVAAAKAMSSGDGKMMKGATGLIAMAVAVKILASACKDLSTMSAEELAKGLIGVGVILAEVALFSRTIGKADKIISSGIALIAIAAGMKIFASAVKDFSGMKWDELGRGLAGMAGALIAVTVAMRLMPKNMFGNSIGLVIVAGALILLSNALKSMSGMNGEEIGRMLAALGGSMIILAFGLNAMNGTLAGSAALVVASLALAIFAPAIKKLGEMSLGSIGKGLIAMAGAFAVLGIAGFLLGPLVPVILALSGALALAGVAIALFGVGIAAVAFGIGALAGVTVAGATAIVSALTVIVAGVAALIPTVVRELGNGVVEFFKVIGESATAIGESVKAIVLTIIDVLIECVPQIADGALLLISEVLASLAQYTPQIVQSLFDFLIAILDGLSVRMPELLQSVVNVFMTFFSGIVEALKGVDVGTFTNALVGVGILLGIMGALSLATSIIPGAMTGAVGMAAVVAELAILLAAIGALAQIPGLEWLIGEGGTLLMNIGNALGGFVGGLIGGIGEGISASLPQIATDLSTFMTNLQPFLDGAKTIDATMLDSVNSIVDIITALSGATLIEGITSWLTGGSSLSTFASELGLFGDGIKQFSDKVVGIDNAAITTATTAAQNLATMASTLPNEGGLLSVFSGDNSMAGFATQLPLFADGIKGFADSVAGINAEAVTTAVTAATNLVAMADAIPNQGGLLALFSGDNNLSTFALQLPLFGEAIKGFADNVAGINTEAVNTAVTAASNLTTMANNLPESGGLWSVFSADNDMSTFGTEIEKFGDGIAKFSSKVADINVTAITSATGVATKMSDIATAIPEGGYSVLETFGDQLKTFGTRFSTFATKFTSVDSATLYLAVTAFNSLVTTLTNVVGTDFASLSTFGTTLGQIGTDGVNSFIQAFTDANTKAKEAGQKLVDNVVAGINSKSDDIGSAMKTAANSGVSAVRGKYDSFKSAGEYIGKGLEQGLRNMISKVKQAAKELAEAAAASTAQTAEINSPSRVFMRFGEYMGQGLVIGMGEYVTKAYNSGQEVANSAIDGLRRNISRISDVINSDVDMQPTIRPVMDLSDITAGARTINGMFGMTPSVSALANVGAISTMMNGNQNGSNNDVISAIKSLGQKLGNSSGDTYNINGVTYDEGSSVANAVKSLVRAVVVERRT